MNRQWRENMVLEITNKYSTEIEEYKPETISDCYDILKTYSKETIKLKKEKKSRKWHRRMKIRGLRRQYITLLTKSHKSTTKKLGNEAINIRDADDINLKEYEWLEDTDPEDDKKEDEIKEAGRKSNFTKCARPDETSQNRDDNENEIKATSKNFKAREDAIIDEFLTKKPLCENICQKSDIEQKFQEAYNWNNNPQIDSDTSMICGYNIDDWVNSISTGVLNINSQ